MAAKGRNYLEETPTEIWENIFSFLRGASIETLAACRETCSSFKYWTDHRASFWSQISLREAIYQRNFPKCQLIIQNVEDVNSPDKFGITPLHLAAGRGLHKIIRLIIAKVQDKNPATNSGETPLHRAALFGHFETYRLILVVGNVPNKNPANAGGQTPLHLAAEHGHWGLCLFILQNVQNKNPMDKNGWTPLHQAAMWGNLEVCRVILENVQNKNPADHTGLTPLDLARNHVDVCQLIQSHIGL